LNPICRVVYSAAGARSGVTEPIRLIYMDWTTS